MCFNIINGACAAMVGFEKGIDRDFEPLLSMAPLN